jgi:hypothetical protein
MKPSLRKTLTILVVFTFLASCGGKKGTTVSNKAIQPPSVLLEQKFEVLTIDNALEKTSFKLPDGTELDIPDSAFVDVAGNAVKEKVLLKFKKYNDAVDILGSGIPMEYDSTGTSNILQTAGMFEIYGTGADGKEVFINPAKKVNVKTRSSVAEDDYNFYAYDTLKSNWIYVGKSEIAERPKTVRNNSGAPIAPQKYDPKGFVLDMKINYSDFSELNSMKGVMWQYAGDTAKNVAKQVQLELKKKWSDLKLELVDAESSLFRLTLSNPKTKMQTLVVPVIAGKGYERAMKEYTKKYEAYKIKYADRIAKDQEEDRKRQVIYRTVGISAFGIYNHDKIMKNTNPTIAAGFQLENGENLDNVTVYHLSGGSATVVKYKPEARNSFKFIKTGGNCLVAFLKDGQTAVFSNDDFKKIDETDLKRERRYTFKMKSTSSQGINADELRKMLNM